MRLLETRREWEYHKERYADPWPRRETDNDIYEHRRSDKFVDFNEKDSVPASREQRYCHWSILMREYSRNTCLY